MKASATMNVSINAYNSKTKKSKIYEQKNTITTQMMYALVRGISPDYQDNNEFKPEYMAIGNGGEGGYATVYDTKLIHQIGGRTKLANLGKITKGTSSYTITYRTMISLSQLVDEEITELGLFKDADGDTCLAHVVFSTSEKIQKTQFDMLDVKWSITLSEPTALTEVLLLSSDTDSTHGGKVKLENSTLTKDYNFYAKDNFSIYSKQTASAQANDKNRAEFDCWKTFDDDGNLEVVGSSNPITINVLNEDIVYIAYWIDHYYLLVVVDDTDMDSLLTRTWYTYNETTGNYDFYDSGSTGLGEVSFKKDKKVKLDLYYDEESDPTRYVEGLDGAYLEGQGFYENPTGTFYRDSIVGKVTKDCSNNQDLTKYGVTLNPIKPKFLNYLTAEFDRYNVQSTVASLSDMRKYSSIWAGKKEGATIVFSEEKQTVSKIHQETENVPAYFGHDTLRFYTKITETYESPYQAQFYYIYDTINKKYHYYNKEKTGEEYDVEKDGYGYYIELNPGTEDMSFVTEAKRKSNYKIYAKGFDGEPGVGRVKFGTQSEWFNETNIDGWVNGIIEYKAEDTKTPIYYLANDKFTEESGQKWLFDHWDRTLSSSGPYSLNRFTMMQDTDSVNTDTARFVKAQNLTIASSPYESNIEVSLNGSSYASSVTKLVKQYNELYHNSTSYVSARFTSSNDTGNIKIFRKQTSSYYSPFCSEVPIKMYESDETYYAASKSGIYQHMKDVQQGNISGIFYVGDSTQNISTTLQWNRYLPNTSINLSAIENIPGLTKDNRGFVYWLVEKYKDDVLVEDPWKYYEKEVTDKEKIEEGYTKKYTLTTNSNIGVKATYSGTSPAVDSILMDDNYSLKDTMRYVGKGSRCHTIKAIYDKTTTSITPVWVFDKMFGYYEGDSFTLDTSKVTSSQWTEIGVELKFLPESMRYTVLYNNLAPSKVQISYSEEEWQSSSIVKERVPRETTYDLQAKSDSEKILYIFDDITKDIIGYGDNGYAYVSAYSVLDNLSFTASIPSTTGNVYYQLSPYSSTSSIQTTGYIYPTEVPNNKSSFSTTQRCWYYLEHLPMSCEVNENLSAVTNQAFAYWTIDGEKYYDKKISFIGPDMGNSKYVKLCLQPSIKVKMILDPISEQKYDVTSYSFNVDDTYPNESYIGQGSNCHSIKESHTSETETPQTIWTADMYDGYFTGSKINLDFTNKHYEWGMSTIEFTCLFLTSDEIGKVVFYNYISKADSEIAINNEEEYTQEWSLVQQNAPRTSCTKAVVRYVGETTEYSDEITWLNLNTKCRQKSDGRVWVIKKEDTTNEYYAACDTIGSYNIAVDDTSSTMNFTSSIQVDGVVVNTISSSKRSYSNGYLPNYDLDITTTEDISTLTATSKGFIGYRFNSSLSRSLSFNAMLQASTTHNITLVTASTVQVAAYWVNSDHGAVSNVKFYVDNVESVPLAEEVSVGIAYIGNGSDFHTVKVTYDVASGYRVKPNWLPLDTGYPDSSKDQFTLITSSGTPSNNKIHYVCGFTEY